MKEVPSPNLPYDYRNPAHQHIPAPTLLRVEPALSPVTRLPRLPPLPIPPAPSSATRHHVKRKLIFTVERMPTGYAANSPAHDVDSVGSTVAELKKNLVEAVNQRYKEEGHHYTETDLKLSIDLAKLFAFYSLTPSVTLAARIGISPPLLTAYAIGQRKPTAKHTVRILQALQAIGCELAALEMF